jgi:hypothetical protein
MRIDIGGCFPELVDQQRTLKGGFSRLETIYFEDMALGERWKNNQQFNAVLLKLHSVILGTVLARGCW